MYYRYPSVRMWSYVDNWEDCLQLCEWCHPSNRSFIPVLWPDGPKPWPCQNIFVVHHHCGQADPPKSCETHQVVCQRPGWAHELLPVAPPTELFKTRSTTCCHSGRGLPSHQPPWPKKWEPFWCQHGPISFMALARFASEPTTSNDSGLYAPRHWTSTKQELTQDLQLSCVCCPPVDPELYCTITTIMAFRNHQSQDLAQFTLQHLAEGDTSSSGPCRSLFTALHKLAWQWIDGETCLDHDGMIVQLVTSPKDQLKQRITAAWQVRTLHLTESLRTTMKGLANTDVALTLSVFQRMPQEHQGLMRCALNGTQFTRDTMFHAGTVDDPSCKFCGEPDSQMHRHWSCKFFADIRAQFPAVHDFHTWPKCMQCHGWLPRSSDLVKLRKKLLCVPDTSDKFSTPALVDSALSFVDLFMDGACIHPTEKDTRLATWGVVQWTGQTFWPVSHGGSSRAEADEPSRRTDGSAVSAEILCFSWQALQIMVW